MNEHTETICRWRMWNLNSGLTIVKTGIHPSNTRAVRLIPPTPYVGPTNRQGIRFGWIRDNEGQTHIVTTYGGAS